MRDGEQNQQPQLNQANNLPMSADNPVNNNNNNQALSMNRINYLFDVLSEQVDTQTDRIAELEAQLENCRSQMAANEELFQSAIESRSRFEATKSDLIDEIQQLRHQVGLADQQRRLGI